MFDVEIINSISTMFFKDIKIKILTDLSFNLINSTKLIYSCILVFKILSNKKEVKLIAENIFYHMKDDINDEIEFKNKLDNIFIINEDYTELYKLVGNFILDNYCMIYDEDFYKKNLNTHQYNILIKTHEYFKTQDKGILNLFCRYGKTRLSSLFCKYSNYNKIIVIVPSLYLINQTFDTWINYYNSKNILKICCEEDDISDNIINNFYNNNNISIFIITYNSSFKLKDYNFDIGIYDEAHRTTGEKNNYDINDKNNKDYKILLTSNKINKKLFLTATTREFVGDGHNFFSMDDKTIYGNIIASVSANEALELKRICPFNIITVNIKPIKEEININEYLSNLKNIDDQDKINEVYSKYIRIAYGLIDTIKKYNIKHIITFHTYIVYCHFFKYILNKICNYKIQMISGSDSKKNREKIINSFQDPNQITILCSAKVLQEGVDIPICDGVIFVDMKKSTIDTIQSLSRCLTYLPNKISYIMIPYDDTIDMKNDEYTSDLRIILRNIIEIDSNLKEYFLETFNFSQNSKKSGQSEPLIQNININSKYSIHSDIIRELQEICYDVYSIAKEKVKNKYKNYFEYIYNVEKDFNKTIPSNPDIIYKIFGWKGWDDFLGLEDSKVNYELLCDKIRLFNFKSKLEYINYAKENDLIINPDIIYKKYWYNWYNFFDIDISIFPKSKTQWKTICESNFINSNNYIQKAKELNLPLMPNEIYKDFTNLTNELDINEYDFI